MAKAGITRRPGLARGMLDELAPLLRAEGIDLDDLGPDVDMDQTNAALARATERHNFELFTPVGKHREQTLALLTELSLILADGDVAGVWALLDTIQPEPTPNTPAISHVIGMALGLLDSWHTDPELRRGLTTVRLPRWTRELGRVGADLLALANKGRAFDSLDALHRRHSGLALYRASALLAATCVNAVATQRNVDVATVAADLLARGGTPEPRPAKSEPRTTDLDQQPTADQVGRARPALSLHGNSSARHPKRGRKAARQSSWRTPPADRAVLREFGRYLRQLQEFAAPTVEMELELMEALLAAARQNQLSLQDPDQLAEFAEIVLAAAGSDDEDDEDPTGAVLATLHDYVHFKLATDDDEGWEDAHDIVEDALAEWEDEGPDPISSIVDEANQIDPMVRRNAFAQTLVVSAVSQLLAWLGSGRPATSSGGLRRVDIQHVAGLLGISAIGVNRRPPIERLDVENEALFDAEVPSSGSGTIHAMSMFEVPLLAAWWEALRVAELLRVASSRVRPGPRAAEWLAEAPPPLELAHTVVGFTVAQALVGRLDRGWFGEEIVAAISVSRILGALSPEHDEIDVDHPFADVFRRRSTRELQELARLGILTLDDEDEIQIPPAIRGAVAHGVGTAVAVLGQFVEATD